MRRSHRARRRVLGRTFDRPLLADLPDGVDPCGERGEFHTFVGDAPGFRSPIDVELGEVVRRDGFSFLDVVPAGTASRHENHVRAAGDTA